MKLHQADAKLSKNFFQYLQMKDQAKVLEEAYE